MRDEHIYYIYMMQSSSRRALYIGMTNNLRKRVWEHKNHVVPGFTEKHKVSLLVWYESHESMENAITREKQLKKWNRDWKLNLIESDNPEWVDLAGGLGFAPATRQR